MAGESLKDQIVQAANPNDNGANKDPQEQEAIESSKKMSLQAQMIAAAMPEGGKPAVEEEMSNWTRYGTVYGKGLLRTPEGVVNTLGHYWHNPEEAGYKALFAGTIGVAMRTFLPKTGAGRAAVGTIMMGMFVKDLAMPLIHAKHDADEAKTRQDLERAASKLGDHMGMFTVDAAAGAWIGGKAERLTGAVLERPTAIAGRLGEGPRAFTEKHIEPRFLKWEKGKEKFWNTDEYFAGRWIGRVQNFMDRSTDRIKKSGQTEEPKLFDHLSKEEKLRLIREAEIQHAAAVDYHMLYRHGMKGADGEFHGFNRTLDLLKRGLNPEQVGSKQDVSAHPYVESAKLDEALAGLRRTRDELLGANRRLGILSDAEARARKTGQGADGEQVGINELVRMQKEELVRRGAKVDELPDDPVKLNQLLEASEKTKGTGTGDKVEETGNKGKPDEPKPVSDLESRVQAEINADVTQKLAEVTAKERQAYTDERMQVDAYKNEKIGQVDNAVNQDQIPLGKEHIPARNSMVKLGDEVQTIQDVVQVRDLFDFFADASTQNQAWRLGAHQRLAKQMNLVGDEFMTFLVEGMQRAGIKDPYKILQGKTPPLYAVSSDLMRLPNGKLAHAGPYTMRRIITDDPVTGNKVMVWGPDLIKYPLNMYGERASALGVFAHENGHDWNGLIAKFLDVQGEGGVLTKAVQKALGEKYHEPAKIVSKDGAVQDLVVKGKKMTQGELIESYLRATRDENTSDIISAATTGINMPLALARLLMGGTREGNLMENSNIFSPKKMASPDNPLGFEVHAIDALRMVISAKTIGYLGKGDPFFEAQAKALMKLSHEGSQRGAYELYNLDSPGQKIVIERDVLNNVVDHLITAQMETPLTVLEGKTFGSILPPFKENYMKMETLAGKIADAIAAGKDVKEVIGDPRQFKVDYTITQVFGAGMPAKIKLVQRGIDAQKAHEMVTQYSDHMRDLYLEGDPHVRLLTPQQQTALPMLSRAGIRQAVGNSMTALKRNAANVIGMQPELRWWTSRNAARIGGGAGALAQDDVAWSAQKLSHMFSGKELAEQEQTRKAMLEQKQ
ncbi:MAG TPA: hypothetical protein V6D17_06200 [Candidatus Obscuribacterales bacterium]